MKEIDIREAFRLTSPNPLILVCTEKEDGSLNMAPVSFFMFTSFTPPMVAFAMGEKKNSGDNFRRTGKAVLVTPGVTLKEAVMKYGAMTGSKTDKLAEYPVPLKKIEGCSLEVPEDVRAVFEVSLADTLSTGDHILYSCRVDRILGDPDTEALLAWKGYAEVETAHKG